MDKMDKMDKGCAKKQLLSKLFFIIFSNSVDSSKEFIWSSNLRSSIEPRSEAVTEYYDYGGFGWRQKKCSTTGGGSVRETTSPTLPKVRYCDNFEPSSNYDLSDDGLNELPNGMEIGFVNGIWNTSEMSKESARYISRFAGGHNIHAVFNATHGMMADLVECSLRLSYRATEPVRQIHRMWNNFFEKQSKTKHLTIFQIKNIEIEVYVINAKGYEVYDPDIAIADIAKGI